MSGIVEIGWSGALEGITKHREARLLTPRDGERDCFGKTALGPTCLWDEELGLRWERRTQNIPVIMRLQRLGVWGGEFTSFICQFIYSSASCHTLWQVQEHSWKATATSKCSPSLSSPSKHLSSLCRGPTSVCPRGRLGSFLSPPSVPT